MKQCWKLKLKWVVLWSLWAARLVRQPTDVIRISNGLVRGSVAPDGTHISYFNIPYATVVKRFKAPGPGPTWNGIYEAINQNVRCPQRFSTTLVGQDNCLSLNVYTPAQTAKKLLPVMLFIHGGGFYEGSGSGNLYGPDYIVPKGVILVTINYRLNIQGFICLGIKEAPGNAGMKDQVSALKWVQRNIRAFGGDPDNVTIFGESAGAASVSFHLLSPMSRGLFHKAILQSGSSLSPWAYQFRPIYMASLLAKTMGYQTENPHELYNIFMNKTNEDLIFTRVPRKEGNIIISELLYSPCTEEKIEGEEPFLSEVPYDILERGDFTKVPLIIGSNTAEGFLFAAAENDTVLPKISIHKSLPKDLKFPSEEERMLAANVIKNHYLGDNAISKESLLNLSKFHSEPFFNLPAAVESELILRHSDKPLYNYLFNYSGWRNIAKLAVGNPFRNAPGATHADDLFYLFKQLPVNLFETKMIERMTRMWTNFAKYGDPTPQPSDLFPTRWLPSSLPNPSALVIDEEFDTSPLLFTESLKYWKQLYTKYRRKR